MSTHTEPRVQGEIVRILLSLIDRDPDQPRFAENVDTDLAGSFKAHGWFPDEPLRVRPHPHHPDRFMLVNGERRYAGAKAAGLKEALCTVDWELEGVRLRKRLITQIMSNTGKPLTVVEEAFAFKRAIEDARKDILAGDGKSIVDKGDPKYGPVALARELGLPKSTVTDRLSLTEIPAFWLKLIVDGPLQPTHVQQLYRWRKVPEKFQLRALEQMKGDYRWPGNNGRKTSGADRLHIGDLETLLRQYMPKFTKPVAAVPGYAGPTEKLKDPQTGKVVVHAMDPAQWQPIHRKKIAERKKREGDTSSTSSRSGGQSGQVIPAWVAALIAAGAERKDGSLHDAQNVIVGVSRDGKQALWSFGHDRGDGVIGGFDPEVLLASGLKVDELVVYVPPASYYSNSAIGTTNTPALGKARSAFEAAKAAELDTVRKLLPSKLTKDPKSVTGEGVPVLLAMIVDNNDRVTLDLDDLGVALELTGFPEVKGGRGTEERNKRVVAAVKKLKGTEASALLSAFLTMHGNDIPSTRTQMAAWEKKVLDRYQAKGPTEVLQTLVPPKPAAVDHRPQPETKGKGRPKGVAAK